MPDACAPTERSSDRIDDDGRFRAVERAALPAWERYSMGRSRAAWGHVVAGRSEAGYDVRLFAGRLG